MTEPWNETTLQTLLSIYKLEDVFNGDEFVLFYQCLPSKTYHLSGEKCSGGKNSKVRLTGMAAASAAFASKQWKATKRIQRLVFFKQWNTWYHHGMPY